MKIIWEIVILFWHYSKVTIKSSFQYRANACIQSVTVFCRESTSVLAMYLTLQYFDTINGWNEYELFFLYSLLYVTYGVMIVFCAGLRDFEKLIYKGDFDRFLVRPQGLLVQVLACKADWFAALGHGGLGIALFVFSANKVEITWSGFNILYYFISILSGTFIQAALFLSFASLSFYTIKADGIKGILYWNAKRIAGYPISVFGKEIQVLLIFVVPFAFVNYFPAQFFLRNNDMNQYPDVLIYFSPIVASIFFSIIYCFWKRSLLRYTSTGN